MLKNNNKTGLLAAVITDLFVYCYCYFAVAAVAPDRALAFFLYSLPFLIVGGFLIFVANTSGGSVIYAAVSAGIIMFAAACRSIFDSSSEGLDVGVDFIKKITASEVITALSQIMLAVIIAAALIVYFNIAKDGFGPLKKKYLAWSQIDYTSSEVYEKRFVWEKFKKYSPSLLSFTGFNIIALLGLAFLTVLSVAAGGVAGTYIKMIEFVRLFLIIVLATQLHFFKKSKAGLIEYLEMMFVFLCFVGAFIVIIHETGFAIISAVIFFVDLVIFYNNKKHLQITAAVICGIAFICGGIFIGINLMSAKKAETEETTEGIEVEEDYAGDRVSVSEATGGGVISFSVPDDYEPEEEVEVTEEVTEESNIIANAYSEFVFKLNSRLNGWLSLTDTDSSANTYQLIKAFQYISYGGLTGDNEIPLSIPEESSDFIVAWISGTLGNLIAVVLILAFLAQFATGIWFTDGLYRRTGDRLPAIFIFSGIISTFSQVLLVYAINYGVFPITGIGCPYLSGKKSLVVFMAMTIVSIYYFSDFRVRPNAQKGGK